MKWLCWMALSLGALGGQAAERFRLDPAGTSIAFHIQQLGVRWVSAHFPDFSGEFWLDARGGVDRVDVIVQMATVACSDVSWNERLRSPEWLDVQHYPQMLFHSERIELGANGRAAAYGALTLHGVTRPIVLAISEVECRHASAADDVCRFDARTRIRRSDFGFAHGIWTGGDQVDIAISGLGVRRRG